MLRGFVTIGQIASHLGMSRQTLRKKASDVLPFLKSDDEQRKVLYSPDEWKLIVRNVRNGKVSKII